MKCVVVKMDEQHYYNWHDGLIVSLLNRIEKEMNIKCLADMNLDLSNDMIERCDDIVDLIDDQIESIKEEIRERLK